MRTRRVDRLYRKDTLAMNYIKVFSVDGGGRKEALLKAKIASLGEYRFLDDMSVQLPSAPYLLTLEGYPSYEWMNQFISHQRKHGFVVIRREEKDEKLSPYTLISSPGTDLGMKNDLAIMDKIASGYTVVSRHLPSEHVGKWGIWVVIDESCSKTVFSDVLLKFADSTVYCGTLHDKRNSLPIPVDFLKVRFSLGLNYLRSLHSYFEDLPAKTCLGVPRGNEVLFVFPERMLPIKRAYYMRAFDLLSSLAANGVKIDALVFGPGNKDLAKIEGCLKNVCSSVNVAPLVRGKFPRPHQAVRYAEKKCRSFKGINHGAPLRFYEREEMFGSTSQIEMLEDVLDKGDYSTVILTGAWFVRKSFELLRRRRINTVVDLHDVFFILDKDANKNEKRYLYRAHSEMARELSAIQKVDKVIAISMADRENLSLAGVKNSLVCSGNFEYSYISIAERPENKHLFGFVGSGNKNNQACLSVLRDKWIPQLSAKYPNLKLKVSGSICSTAIAEDLKQKFPDNIELLGFVDDIREFYKSVNIILSPIRVQGGLNFKSVEGLVAGRFVVTTPLGARCLGDKSPVFVADEEGISIVKVIRKILLLDPFIYCKKSQEVSMSTYGLSTGYSNLLTYLKSVKP